MRWPWTKPRTRRDIIREGYPEHHERIMRYAVPFWVCYPEWLDMVPKESDGAAVLKGLFHFDMTTEGKDYWHMLLDPSHTPQSPEMRAKIQPYLDSMLLMDDKISEIVGAHKETDPEPAPPRR